MAASTRGSNGFRTAEPNGPGGQGPAEPNGQGERRPSIADVATVARVSHQTVSRVLNDNPSVGELTRARVLAAIDQLGYRPNIAARALASGRSKTLGVVAMDTSLYGPVSTLYGFQLAAQQYGYFVSVVAVHSIDRQSVRDAVRWLTSQSVEGLAVIAPLTSAHDALATLPTGTPVVAVEGDPEANTSVVTVDQVAGAKLATEHLLGAGYGTVFHVAGPRNGWRRAAAPPAGGRHSSTPAPTSPLRCPATGAPVRGTRQARSWLRYRTPGQFSWPTTTWRWGCSGPFTSGAARYRRRWPWSASTTPRVRLFHPAPHDGPPGLPASGPGGRAAPGGPAQERAEQAGTGGHRPRAGLPAVQRAVVASRRR